MTKISRWSGPVHQPVCEVDNTLPVSRRYAEDIGLPAVANSEAEGPLQVGNRAAGGFAKVRLADDGDVGDLHDASLHELQTVAGAWLSAEYDDIGQISDSGLALPDPDRFDQHHVEQGAEQHHDLHSQFGEPTQLVTRGERADKEPLIRRIGINPRTVAEQCAAGPPAGWIHRQNGDRPAGLPEGPDERVHQCRFANSGWAGKADRHTALMRPGVIQQRLNIRIFGRGLEAGERRGDGALSACPYRLKSGAAAGQDRTAQIARMAPTPPALSAAYHGHLRRVMMATVDTAMDICSRAAASVSFG